MNARRRLAAIVVLILHVVIGMRPAVASATMGTGSAARVVDCHGNDAPRASSGETVDPSHAGHDGMSPSLSESDVASEPGTPGDDAPPPRHPSHHDTGCHGAPCCAPVLPLVAEGLPSSTSVKLGFQRPLSGAARIVWAAGARLLPPATAPPALLLA
jgi:hypothetical protein